MTSVLPGDATTERRVRRYSTGPVPWTDRAGALCGAAYVLLILVGNQIASGSQTDPHPSGEADLAAFARHDAAGHVGFAMEVTGLLCFILFLGWFSGLLRRRGGAADWLAGAVSGAGIITLAVKLASVMPIQAGEIDRTEISPTIARVLADMNGAAFVVTFLPFGVFLVASGLAVLSSEVQGRFSGWAAVAIGLLTLGVTLVTGADPTGTNPMPFVAGLLWILVTSVRLAWRGPRGRAGSDTVVATASN